MRLDKISQIKAFLSRGHNTDQSLDDSAIAADKPIVRKRKYGITLVEALLVVAVGAVIVSGVVTLYTSASSNQRVNQAIQQVQKISGDTRSLFSGQAGYTGLNNAIAISAGVVSPDMLANNNNIRNPWSGQVDISASESDNTNFTIEYNSLPETACLRLAQAISGGSGLAQLNVSGNTLLDTTNGTNTTVDVADAEESCSADNNNTITWTFR